MEELHSELSMEANFSALEMRTSAAAEMTVKDIQCMGIDTLQTAAFPLNKATEMGGAANISNSTGWGVSFAFEVTGEAVDVRSTDSTAQAP
jgi:hypothetical protein